MRQTVAPELRCGTFAVTERDGTGVVKHSRLSRRGTTRLCVGPAIWSSSRTAGTKQLHVVSMLSCLPAIAYCALLFGGNLALLLLAHLPLASPRGRLFHRQSLSIQAWSATPCLHCDVRTVLHSFRDVCKVHPAGATTQRADRVLNNLRGGIFYIL